MKKTAVSKILVIFYLVALLLMIFPATAFADGNFSYSINNGEATIFNYTGDNTIIILPDKINDTYPITEISESMFEYCNSLEKITLPAYLKKIDLRAFCECSNLSEVNLPGNLQEISANAFTFCYKLKNVTIPASVTKIGYLAFCRCISFTQITVGANNQYYYSQDGVLFNKSKTELIQYPVANPRTSYEIPQGVTTIDEGAFASNKLQTDTTINNYLQRIVLPDSVISIGNGAFSKCFALNDVTLGNNVKSIGSGAFYGCSQIKKLMIPKSTSFVDDTAFTGCTGLTLYGYSGSYIEGYAKNHGIPFVAVDKITYTVSYGLNYGAGAVYKTQNIVQGQLAEKLEDPVRTGYQFCGWYKDSACKTPWDFYKDTVTRNIALFAKWKKYESGLFAEYFQYRDQDYPFSAVDKRYEVKNDVVDKNWANKSYSKKVGKDKISYDYLSVKTMSKGAKQSAINFIKKEKMAVRWNGVLKPGKSASYFFRVRGNGGISFYLSDNKYNVIASFDKWSDSLLDGVLGKTKSIKLKANTDYPIIIEYFNKGGNAKAVLEWSADGGKKWSAVPKSVLFSTSYNRTVSVKSLNEAYTQNLETAKQELSQIMEKNYLLSGVASLAQSTALNALGARTKLLFNTAKKISEQVLSKQKPNISKIILPKILPPASAAVDFFDTFKDLLSIANNAISTNQKRALGFLLLSENKNATIFDLPEGYATWCEVNQVGLKDFPKTTDIFFKNMGKIAGTMIRAQREEFYTLAMSAIAKVYIFEYTDYLKLIVQ